MSDIVKLYNPANASALTPDEVAGLQNLTSEQIKELAQAYPNLTMQKAYLLIIDSSKPIDKQIPTLSTFQNLWNLREKNGQRKYVAYQFKGNYKARPVPHVAGHKSQVIDLSETELLDLPGLKINKPTPNGIKEETIIPAETVQVKKVKRTKKS